MKSQQKNKSIVKNINKKTAKRLASCIFSKHKFTSFVVLLCILISSLSGVCGSLFLQTLIDDYITPLMTQANPVFTGLIKAVAVMGIIYLVGVIATIIQTQIVAVVTQKILREVRDDMFAHMQTLPIKYFDTNNFGDIMSIYTNDTGTLRQLISQSIPSICSSLITVITVFATMLYLSPIITILVVCTAILMYFVTSKIGGRSSKYFVKQQEALGELNGYIEELINGQKVVKVFCHEDKAKEMFDEKNENLRFNTYKANKYANILMPIMMNIGNLQYVLIAVLGGAIAISGISTITLGTIASFLHLSKGFTMPISQMAQQLNSIAMAFAGSERIFKLLDEESEVDDGNVILVNAKYKNGNITESKKRTGLWAWKYPRKDGTIVYEELKGDVRFFDVDFGYEEDKIVLHDISLFAEPSQKVAFVGATGAGKTTITNLINRFYDLADGKIRYDNININKIKKSDLRRSLGMVLQDTNLFTGTIAENIRYGKLDASNAEIIKAAKLANADGFIKRLPNGYNTVITGDGGSLSQGQRQLIAIARAAVNDPPVMILDEATSSIDTRTEAIVQQGMDSLMKGRTVFVIAHRLSTIKNSDVIMVLENGRIIERGSHEKLLEEKGKYYQLYTGAFELE